MPQFTKASLSPISAFCSGTEVSINPEAFEPAITEHMDRVFGIIHNTGLKTNGRVFVFYHHYGPETTRFDVCVPVEAGSDTVEGLREMSIPELEVVGTVHEGPYSGLHETYRSLGDYCKANNINITDSAIEIYLNDPENTPENDLQTQIWFLIAGN